MHCLADLVVRLHAGLMKPRLTFPPDPLRSWNDNQAPPACPTNGYASTTNTLTVVAGRYAGSAGGSTGWVQRLLPSVPNGCLLPRPGMLHRTSCWPSPLHHLALAWAPAPLQDILVRGTPQLPDLTWRCRERPVQPLWLPFSVSPMLLPLNAAAAAAAAGAAALVGRWGWLQGG